jgi:hypothetical protein
MAEQQSNNNQTMMYVLVGVVVLLVAVVGYMFYARSQPASLNAATTTTAATTTGAQAPAGMGQQAATVDPNAPVDTKTATKVTGADPKAFVSQYYTAVTKKDWATAYKMLPYSVKSQQDEATWGSTQNGYGIKSFKVTKSEVQGDSATVVVSMDTASYGAFSNQWTFKKVGDAWYVVSKKTMMGQ